ncbi:hypothetical protein H1P_20033 [Hyella patelloides LEGE 07179]|uniref:Transposase n=1 Tax=Hyella patelloides LEGE 07179 TaxID=945734 RepID=A0A563VPN6_9CYAN|nr:hypothetical protein H1P_20033 [Hyella patelloides LEGE 07179]
MSKIELYDLIIIETKVRSQSGKKPNRKSDRTLIAFITN